MNCKFRAFRATDDTEACKIYSEGHDAVLKEYSVPDVNLKDKTWMKNPNVYCIVAESVSENKIIGGVRIQVSDGSHLLPIEMAIGRMNKMITNVIQDLRHNGGVAEVTALWHSKRVAGIGMSTLLLRAAVSVFAQLKIKTLMTLSSDYTLDKFYYAGFRELEQLTGQSNYPYPTELYSAKVLGIVDLENLKSAEADDRKRIQSLRNSPKQNFIEFEKEQGIKAEYDLLIK